MAITAKYILICDDLRREDNGKLILMGLYMTNMTVPSLPFVMPTLTFFMSLEADRPGNYPFRFRLEHQETGNRLAEGMGMLPISNPQQPIVAPIKIGGFQFIAPGSYSFSVEIEGQRDPIITTFNVILAAAVGAIQAPIPPRI